MNEENMLLALRELDNRIKLLVNDYDGSEVFRRAKACIFKVKVDSIRKFGKDDLYEIIVIDKYSNEKTIYNYLTEKQIKELKAWPYVLTVVVNRLINTIGKNGKKETILDMKTPLGVATFDIGTPLYISEFPKGKSLHAFKNECLEKGYITVSHEGKNAKDRVLVKIINNNYYEKEIEETSGEARKVLDNYKSVEVNDTSSFDIETVLPSVITDEGKDLSDRNKIKVLKKLRYIEFDDNHNPIKIMKTSLPICRNKHKFLDMPIDTYRELCNNIIYNDTKRAFTELPELAEAFNVHSLLGIDTFYDSEGNNHQLVYRLIDKTSFDIIDNNLIYISNGDIIDLDGNFIRKVNND